MPSASPASREIATATLHLMSLQLKLERLATETAALYARGDRNAEFAEVILRRRAWDARQLVREVEQIRDDARRRSPRPRWL